MLIKHWGFIVLWMAVSFCSLISKKAREITCFLLLFLPHIASHKTCDQLLKINKPWKGRNAGCSFDKECGTKQRFISPHMLDEYPCIQEHQTFRRFHLRHQHTLILYSLCAYIRNFNVKVSHISPLGFKELNSVL